MYEKFYISKRFFSEEELKVFHDKFEYDITEIAYSSGEGEVDFSKPEEKEFLLRNGYPMILARFFA